jgi:1-acyl-sn-glycerol-3-phosphate acyltransferase
MRPIIGILSTTLVVSNLIINSVPLFLMTLLRIVVRLLGLKNAESQVARWADLVIDSWVVINRFIFRTLGLARIEVSWENAAELNKDRWYLVVSNHQSWTDIFMLQTELYDALPPLKFFTKRQLLYIPVFGQAMWALDFPYVRRMSRAQIEANPALLEVDRQAIRAACEKFKNHPTTALNFLEGTRFTAEKYEAQAAPRFQHLLNPKTGGVTQVLAALSDRLDKLVDVTIDYPDGVPSFWEFMQGRCSRVTMHIHCPEIPEAITDTSDEEARRDAVNQWVETLWQTKDARLASVREGSA